MGKKTDKTLKDKVSNIIGAEEAKSAVALALSAYEKAGPQTAEEYQCTGNLEQDFTELCIRTGLTEIPRVTVREHPGVTRTVEKTPHDEADTATEKDSNLSTSMYSDRFTYFKPSIQTVHDVDETKSVRDIFIRGWKIDEKMMGILTRCMSALPNLQQINLWNVGLTDETLAMLIDCLPHCTHLKTVVLDGNPLKQQSYHKLITEENTIANLVLRNNQIDDEGVQLIGQAIQNLKTGNKNFASLNLSFNHIGDKGAGFIAESLRFNRSLLWLDLSHNKIGDEGALKLAEVLGHFSLTDKEIMERRTLLSKDIQDQYRVGVTSIFEAKNERPSSHMSSTAPEKPEKAQPTKGGKTGGRKKDKEKDSSKKDEKSGGGQTLGVPGTGMQTKKEDSKTSKKQFSNLDQKASRARASKSAAKERRIQVTESEPIEIMGPLHPLLEPTEHRDGTVYMSGNKTLISLNLTRNQITRKGLKGFLTAVQIQVKETKQIQGTKNASGLLRLSIAKNAFPAESQTYLKIQELLMPRDPVHGTQLKSIEEEAASAS